jgi:hypothetical protein
LAFKALTEDARREGKMTEQINAFKIHQCFVGPTFVLLVYESEVEKSDGSETLKTDGLSFAPDKLESFVPLIYQTEYAWPEMATCTYLPSLRTTVIAWTVTGTPESTSTPESSTAGSTAVKPRLSTLTPGNDLTIRFMGSEKTSKVLTEARANIWGILEAVKQNFDNEMSQLRGAIQNIKLPDLNTSDLSDRIAAKDTTLADRLAGGMDTINETVGAVPFPMLMEQINPPGIPRLGQGGLSGSAPLGQIVEGALRDVLGWKPRSDDPKGFVGALTQSFSLKETEGHTEWSWLPRSYAVQTDLSGGITGAQASLHIRAKDAVDKALPLLEGLYALRDDADPEDSLALKAIIRSRMEELVSELGVAGGPRVSRVNQTFDLLIGNFVPPQPIETDPDKIAGLLGTLRKEFGLRSVSVPGGEKGNFVNTVEEEQNLTNFRILVDYLTALRASWSNNSKFFERPTAQPFFGTQLVQLSRQLSVIAESVDEIRYVMDSVYIGPDERQVLELELGLGGISPEKMFVEELLSWVQHFATLEGPNLIQAGGKFAVQEAFKPIVDNLQNLVDAAVEPDNLDELPQGYKTTRVKRAWEALASQLDQLSDLASPIKHTIPAN